MNTPDVTVTISDFGYDTAEDVLVTLTPTAVMAPTDPANLRAKTNAQGVATFSNVPPGQYSLAIAGRVSYGRFGVDINYPTYT